MAGRRVNMTKYEIVKMATELFLERGYTATTPRIICDELGISTGNLTYYFPTKETLLAVLVELLCSFQSKGIKDLKEEGTTSLFPVCVEMAYLVTAVEEDPIAKDVFRAFYLSPICLNYIRQNDVRRAKYIYGKYCPDWTERQYIEAEISVSGIEYAALMTEGDMLPVENRISSALNNIMMIFNVPEDIRKQEIERILAMDYRMITREMLRRFREFVAESNAMVFDDLLNKSKEAN